MHSNIATRSCGVGLKNNAGTVGRGGPRLSGLWDQNPKIFGPCVHVCEDWCLRSFERVAQTPFLFFLARQGSSTSLRNRERVCSSQKGRSSGGLGQPCSWRRWFDVQMPMWLFWSQHLLANYIKNCQDLQISKYSSNYTQYHTTLYNIIQPAIPWNSMSGLVVTQWIARQQPVPVARWDAVCLRPASAPRGCDVMWCPCQENCIWIGILQYNILIHMQLPQKLHNWKIHYIHKMII